VSMPGGYDGPRRLPPRTAYDAPEPRASAAAREIHGWRSATTR
jgi:hypothetical protein